MVSASMTCFNVRVYRVKHYNHRDTSYQKFCQGTEIVSTCMYYKMIHLHIDLVYKKIIA